MLTCFLVPMIKFLSNLFCDFGKQ